LLLVLLLLLLLLLRGPDGARHMRRCPMRRCPRAMLLPVPAPAAIDLVNRAGAQ
jgi:hypothetical protein